MKNNLGMSLMHLAVIDRNWEIVNLLLKLKSHQFQSRRLH